MDTLQSILPRVLHKRGLRTQMQACLVTYVAQQWIDAALPQIAEFVRVTKFSHTTLSIQCSHSIAAQECLPLLPALKEYLQKTCPKDALSEILLMRNR
jgi:hypothetical protein